jgi:acyl dehydratase
MGVDYGLDRLRFITPVRAGSCIRARFRLLELVRRREGEFMMRYEVKVEIEGSDKPAIVADWLTLSMFG